MVLSKMMKKLTVRQTVPSGESSLFKMESGMLMNKLKSNVTVNSMNHITFFTIFFDNWFLQFLWFLHVFYYDRLVFLTFSSEIPIADGNVFSSDTNGTIEMRNYGNNLYQTWIVNSACQNGIIITVRVFRCMQLQPFSRVFS